MARKPTKAEQIARTPLQIIASLKGEAGRKQLINYVKTMRSSYKRRAGSFKRKGLISQAQLALERQTPKSKSVQLTEMSRNQLMLEFYKYASFFNSETATEQGIKKVNREQDIRIFGANKRGLPKQRMTDEERVLFWDTYEEYINQFPADINQLYSSESIQQMLADVLLGGKKTENANLVALLQSVRQRLEAQKTEENIKDVPNIFSGRRSHFDW